MANRNRATWEARLLAIGLTGRLPDRLTERVIEAAQKRPTGARYVLADGKVPGLALAVAGDGSASYVMQVRTLAGIARCCGLGSAATVTLEDARAAAERIRALVKDGGDPVAEKQAARAEARAEQASTVRRYLLDTYDPKVLVHQKSGAATKDRILASWEPLLDVPIGQLTRAQIEAHLAAHKAETKADGSRKLANATLNREWAVFRAMLSDAVRRGALAAQPVAGKPEPLRGLREEPSRRYLGKDDPTETKRFLDALAAYESNEPGGGEFARVACALALNCGLRRGEVVRLRDAMIVEDAGHERLELPAAICKGNKSRVVPLNLPALEAIQRWNEVRKTLKVESIGGELFPGDPKLWADRLTQRDFPCIREAADIDAVFKTLRATFASLHVQRGTPIQIVQQWLGHYSVTLTEKHYAYLRSDTGQELARAFRVS